MTPPELVYVGDIKVDTPRLTIIEFGIQHYREHRYTEIPQEWPQASADNVVWVNLHGLQDVDLLMAVGQQFELHPLVLEDILNTQQRPKFEEYPNYLFIVAKLVALEKNHLNIDQFGLILGKNSVLTFQERPIGAFKIIRDSLHHSRSLIARMGADHLSYLLLDAVTDLYFDVMENLSNQAESLDNRAMFHPDPLVLRQIHGLKRLAAQLRRLTWPLRDVMHQLAHHETPLIDPETRLYVRDIQDHVLHVLEALDFLRDQIGGLLEMYMSGLSNRLNQQMRVLTVITTFFMPLTLIAGIYGMNFDFMPELHWRYGYFMVLGLMVLLVGFMTWLFRKIHWI